MWSVFTALVVPRVTSSQVQRGVARLIGGGARRLVPKLPTYEVRDRVLSFVGPAAMVLLFAIWLVLLVLGFGCIIWWDAGIDFASALGVAGSSVFTLGIASEHFAGPETLEIVSAGIGLLVIALEIAYLPALYGAFASRETQVTLLAGRSGTPAWGPEILARSHFLDTMDELPPLYLEWERWAATVSESHANYPALMWFRSPVSTRSWLLGLTAMMDSGALYHSVSPELAPARRGCACPWASTVCAPWPVPSTFPTSSILCRRPASVSPGPSSTRGSDGSRSVDFPLERDADEAWRHFQGWRVNYEPIVDALTRLVVPPPAPWFIARPELGAAAWPLVLNRTPDEPEGSQFFGSKRIFKTPSDRESKSS